MPASPNLLGQRFGMLIVAERLGSVGGEVRWRCACDCGGETRPTTGMLRSGNTASCGCGQRAAAAATCRHRATHGGAGSRLYTIWRGMHARCSNPKNISYPDYGGRGIEVCDEWRSFAAFAKWARSAGYDDTLSIDREDNDRGYEPANCRWLSIAAQNLNRRSNRRITADGRTMTVAEWSRETGIAKSTLLYRADAGVSPAAAVSVQPDRRNRFAG